MMTEMRIELMIPTTHRYFYRAPSLCWSFFPSFISAASVYTINACLYEYPSERYARAFSCDSVCREFIVVATRNRMDISDSENPSKVRVIYGLNWLLNNLNLIRV